ncbi:hypothetical protein GBAR_LOCUS9435 [Geodia barretti]|uniref:Uncharacterized protein n=1 Tax=Geodia barretti TaxID=519541 RepID=A0AA35RP41_GEOBA|nr:hypothetical protein GBAR_LOCUS9435 [Geodia barretti]
MQRHLGTSRNPHLLVVSVGGGGGGGGKGRKRNSRSASGGSSYRSRSPKRRSGKEGGKGGGGGGGGEKEGGKEKESTAAVVSCELEWDSGSHGEQEPGELIINGGVSPAKETLLTKQASLESTASSVDKTSGASAQGGSGEGGEEGEEDGTLTKTGEKVGKDGAESEESTTQPRHTYTRVQLLALKDHTLSQKKPESLQGKFFRQGKWCAEAWLTPQSSSEETAELEEGETGETAVTGKTLPKLKNPTTLSIIREHEVRGYGKVCLSPQRRSFGSGCSWNTSSSSSSSAKDGGHTAGASSSSSANNRDSPFDGNAPDSRRGARSSGYHHSNHAHSHSPMVINHIPLRDKKGWKGDGGRAGERDRGRSYGGFKSKEIEEEPEWMSFGPTDRSEVIELVGLEEHERGRDGGE